MSLPPPTSNNLPPSLRGYSILPEAPDENVIGGRFEVRGLVGRGGTADVYLTRDRTTSDHVVVKRLRPEVAKNRELHDRFLLEAEALKLVDHPAVIRILSIERPDNEPPYLVLEPLRGESLGDHLKREGLIDPELAVRLLREVVTAVEGVHAAGIVHRDLKPDNVFLVGPIGDPSHVKVLDFGMARLGRETHDESSMSILGTVQYMAPEQILVEPVDERTDVYALGVMLFRMITGQLPFDTPDTKDLVRHQLFSPVPPATWLVEELLPGLEAVIYRATRKNPESRYSDMKSFGAALDAVLGLAETEAIKAAELDPDDVYRPKSEKGEQAARVLARAFRRTPSTDGTT
jgi:eukaryotic-like serine/threonine-protein kinase